MKNDVPIHHSTEEEKNNFERKKNAYGRPCSDRGTIPLSSCPSSSSPHEMDLYNIYGAYKIDT